MDPAFYTELASSSAGTGVQAEFNASFGSAAACGGPWSAEQQHGGPPSALLVRVAERLAESVSGRGDLLASRIAAEFIGPVPVAPLSVSARIVRLARSAVLVSAELSAAGRTCLQARVWLLARQPDQPAATSAAQVRPEAEPDARPEAGPEAVPESLPPFDIAGFGYAQHLDFRQVSGWAYQPGPATVWARPLIPLLAGEPLSTLQRLALIGDSASGISAALDWDSWSFANVDLDVHLLRELHGDWLLMDAATEVGAGLALTRCSLGDSTGLVGAGLQTLVIRRRS